MFCPVCRLEYREGFTKCADCGLELVPALPAENPIPDNIPLVPVFESSDWAMILVARSLLDGSGIPHLVKNDLLQDLMGMGRIGGGNLITGPAAIVVREDDAKAASELLEDLRSGTTELI
jgi:hypothetical protein